jgi:hypothetical protein
VLGRQRAFRRAGLAAVERLDEQRAIDGHGNGPAHAHIAQDGIAQVEDDVVKVGAGAFVDRQAGIAAQRVHHVGGQGVALHVG